MVILIEIILEGYFGDWGFWIFLGEDLGIVKILYRVYVLFI